MFFNGDRVLFHPFYSTSELLDSMVSVIKRKSFFVNVFLSLLILLVSPFIENVKLSRWYGAKKKLVWIIFCLLLYWLGFSFIKASPLDSMLSVFVIVSVFLSLPVVDFVFWSLNPFRDTKTGVYFLFLLFILLDSHLEGRIKVFLRFFSQV